MRKFVPLCEDAARYFRHGMGSPWSAGEACVEVAGARAYVYRAIDEHGRVVDVYVSARRAADAAARFRGAIEPTGVAPSEVTTDCTAAYPSAVAAILPEAAPETGKQVQQRIERDRQHLKGRVQGLRDFKMLSGARVLCAGHAFLGNLRGDSSIPGG